MPAYNGMTAVMKYFGLKPSEFGKQWKMMTEQDKNDLKDAIGSYDEETGVATGPLDY